jgi:DNA-binding response OmpR family regulator
VLKVLIAEDDLIIADMVEDLLVESGYEVCGIGRTVAESVALAQRHKPDLAVIDVRLADEGLGTDIPAQLDASDRPGVLYATANISTCLTTAEGQACISKPFRSPDLLRSLEIVVEIVATGTASPPFPHGFSVLPLASDRPRERANGSAILLWPDTSCKVPIAEDCRSNGGRPGSQHAQPSDIRVPTDAID